MRSFKNVERYVKEGIVAVILLAMVIGFCATYLYFNQI